jgi:hypothetical protein
VCKAKFIKELKRKKMIECKVPLQLLMLLKKFQKVSKRFKKNEDGDD